MAQSRPAYDILPSDGINGYRTTSINDSIKPTKEDLIILAIKTGLNKKEADVVFEEMKDKRISGFEF